MLHLLTLPISHNASDPMRVVFFLERRFGNGNKFCRYIRHKIWTGLGRGWTSDARVLRESNEVAVAGYCCYTCSYRLITIQRAPALSVRSFVYRNKITLKHDCWGKAFSHFPISPLERLQQSQCIRACDSKWAKGVRNGEESRLCCFSNVALSSELPPRAELCYNLTCTDCVWLMKPNGKE